MLGKNLFAVILFLGLNVFNYNCAQADDFLDCPIQGQISMRLEGTVKAGQLSGFIDNNYVSWFVRMGNIQEFYNGNFIILRLEQIKNNELNLSGRIGTYYLNWRSFGGQFNESIYCP